MTQSRPAAPARLNPTRHRRQPPPSTFTLKTSANDAPSPWSNLPSRSNHQQALPPQHFKVTLDGGTLYIPQEVAEALGWKEGTPTEGVALRLSGWAPHYFAITQKGTDADLLAHGTIESSRNPVVQETLEYLKKNDSM
ncbi:hypothetical protein CC2G_008444 [Coprinopsis cinerea AmutBmut pab1-1]|nr:hypothetical protein CC2G_008444 [Coprinopsis cinerea AmutBmut pab1-1]